MIASMSAAMSAPARPGTAGARLVAAWLACFGLDLAHASPVGAAAQPSTSTHWMETRLADVPTGYLREQSAPVAGGGWTTELESKLVLNRMDSRVEVRSVVRYQEDAAGVLQTISAEVGSSAESTAIHGKVVDGVLRLDSSAGGRDYRTETPLQQPLLGPQGIRERSRSALRKAGDRIEYATFVGEFAAVAAVVREVTGSETLTLAGKPASTIVVRETMDVMPVPTVYWLDAQGRALRMRQQSPFGLVENVRADADVQQRVAAGGKLPDETYQNAVARSNIRLPRPRSVEQLQVRIDLKRADSQMPALDGPDQSVLERGERHAVIVVRRAEEPLSTAPAGGADAAQWLQSNAWLQADHPQVIALAQSLRRPGLGAYAQARVLQDWVATHMQFDAGIALVSASEAVRDRRGTCMAYAVVLTSLARALELPSRVVMGYIYAANMWGGHAWSEVLIDGRWVALDAAVWRAGPADAARIGVIRTSLEQGMASGLASLAQLYGNERVQVLDYTLDGRSTTVPADALAHSVAGREYRNDWLGVRFQAPDGFDFAEVDIMYPRSEIVVLRSEAGARIVIEQRSLRPGDGATPAAFLRSRGFAGIDAAAPATRSVAGRPAWVVEHEDKAAAAWLDDSDLWFVHAEGADASAAIAALLDGFALRR